MKIKGKIIESIIEEHYIELRIHIPRNIIDKNYMICGENVIVDNQI